MQTQRVEYQAGDTQLKGFLAYDPSYGGKRPGIIIIHDWSGCNEFVQNKAKQIAGMGYVGFAVDMYGDGNVATSKEDKTKLMQPLLLDRSLLKERILSAYNTIKTFDQVDSTKIGAMGYCFGGVCSLDLARSGAAVRGVISLHGLFTPPSDIGDKAIQAKVLALHGYADPMVPPEQVIAFSKEMDEAKADWQVHMYGNAMHAFTNPEANDIDFGILYDKKADQRSWQTVENFFDEIFS